MAVANIYGKDSQCFGWDVTQFRTEEEKAILEYEIRYFREAPGAFYDDGLIFFVPEMVLFPWSYADDSIMKRKFFRVHMPWEDGRLGLNWTPFYEKVKNDLNWRCFKVFSPIDPERDRYIFYKLGIMPLEPRESDIGLVPLMRGDSFYFDKNTVEQGNIVYRNKTIWDKINRELAFQENTRPFEEALASFDILI